MDVATVGLIEMNTETRIRPNLFSFATSELSQDAFLCWLIAHANEGADSELGRAGRAFIAWLWSLKTGRTATAIALRGPPIRQHKKIDVLFKASVDNAEVTFIIEDKTETTQHDGQLERYSGEFPGAICIYLKTGYHFGQDVAAARAGYVVVGLSELLRFLQSQAVTNHIYVDYREHLEQMLRSREDNLLALKNADGHMRFDHDYVQYEFINTLAAACASAVGQPESTPRSILRGRGLSGEPWTHYRFAVFDGALGGQSESLFHRVDRRSDGFYVSTRQYGVVKGNKDAQSVKLQRLRQWREAFRAATEGSSLNFGQPSGDHRGANESEIGVLFFDSSRNTVENVLRHFPAVHSSFMALLPDDARRT